MMQAPADGYPADAAIATLRADFAHLAGPSPVDARVLLAEVTRTGLLVEWGPTGTYS